MYYVLCILHTLLYSTIYAAGNYFLVNLRIGLYLEPDLTITFQIKSNLLIKIIKFIILFA